ncbi:hypothetical protein JHK84_047855 [Glycine max]|nr:hypothetical protein JHK86_047832 [Glycine max]KAG4933627.1 hypothetical protein JHK87_047629 [Glycine soja]KAG4943800.1 hypothetical protein JHK85_048446 [Glycine max]KAG5102886.1 hypothetical protein JHK84_047855 [Glycine max]
MEKAAFLQAVSSFDEDFRMIARHVGAKSKDQCKKFFIKGQKSHRLDLMRHILENIGSLLNEINLGMSTDTNDAHIVEADSVTDNDKLGTKTIDDQPSFVVNSSRDKSKPMEARNLSTNFKELVIGNDKSGTKTNDEQSSFDMNSSHDKSKSVEAKNRSADLNESKEINREFDHQDKTIISNKYNDESKLVDTDGCGVVLYNYDKSSSVKDKKATTMSNIMEVRKDNVGDAVTELVSSASKIIEPYPSHFVVEDRLSVMLMSFPTWLDDKDGKHGGDIDDDVVELKNQSHDSNTKANTCLSSVLVSFSTLTFGVENQLKLFLKKSNYLGPSMEDPIPTANSMLQNTIGVLGMLFNKRNQLHKMACL